MFQSLFSKASLTAILLLAHQAHAFFPTDFRENLVGNGGVSHIKQTEEVWKSLALDKYFTFLDGKFSKAMEAAMKTVSDANAAVDDNQHDSELHFDGENFIGGQARLRSLKKDVKDALGNKDATKARVALGSALHTVQDFYAHSNWVELGFRGASEILGSDTENFDFAGPLDDTCTSCTGLAGALFFNTLGQRLNIADILAKLVGSVFGVAVPGVRVCEDCHHNMDLAGGAKLTSGYYYGEDKPPQAGKCHHGGYFDNPLSSIDSINSKVIEGIEFIAGTVYLPPTGINKDSLACDWSPHSFLHPEAVAASKLATAQFIDDIAKSDGITNAQLELLFGVGTTFAFVMDTTGSMSDIQASVAAQAIQIATDRLSTTDNVDLFIISEFNDPGTGPVQSVSDIAEFTAIMNGLTASGGGDCPELSMTGILNAIQEVTESTELFLFTDAASKDAGLESQVIAAALDKDVHINIFKFDSGCDDGLAKRVDSASNKVYGSLAAATGGTYHSLPRNNVGSISSLLETLTASSSNAVLKISATSDGSEKTYSFPVDSLMTQVSISTSGAGVSFTYKNPGGAIPAANINTVTLADGKHITITSPPAGLWEITISGTGNYNLDVSGISPLHFSVFDFVESRGRAGHSGYFPIADLPPYNVDIGVIARLFGDFTSATFSFKKPDGSLITTLALTPGSGEVGFPDTSTFFGVLRLPNEAFYIYSSGIDDKGQPFQRLLATVVNPVFTDKTYHIGSLNPLDLGKSISITIGGGNTTRSNATTSSTRSSSTRSSTPSGSASASTSLGPYSNATTTSAIYQLTEIVYTTTTICPVTDAHTTGMTTYPVTLTSTVTNHNPNCIAGTYTSYKCDCKPADHVVATPTYEAHPYATPVSTKEHIYGPAESSVVPGNPATKPASPSYASAASYAPAPSYVATPGVVASGNATATGATKPIATYVPGSLGASLRGDVAEKLWWTVIGVGAVLGAMLWEGGAW